MAWPSKRSVLDAIERAVDAPARWLRYAVTGVDDGDEKQNARFRGLVVLGGPLIGVLGLRLASHAPGAALVVRSVTRPPRALGAGLRARGYPTRITSCVVPTKSQRLAASAAMACTLDRALWVSASGGPR